MFFLFFRGVGWAAGAPPNFRPNLFKRRVLASPGIFFCVFSPLGFSVALGVFFRCFLRLFGCGVPAAARAKPFEMLGFGSPPGFFLILFVFCFSLAARAVFWGRIGHELALLADAPGHP